MNETVVMFYVQHLLGVGHVYRATRIARGLAKAGFQVHLVWGGTKLPDFELSGMTVHFLDPVRAGDASFSDLCHADGRPFGEEDKEHRRKQLLRLFSQISPDVLITEAFPFGRRQMLFELLPLLELASKSGKRPLIAASIRDIMQEGRKPSRVEESCKFVDQYYDLVFVHGDPALVRIEETLQGAERFADKIRYTGLVTPDQNETQIAAGERCDVLVSVGGGAFGRMLLETSLKAHSLMPEHLKHWLVTTGTEMAQTDFSAVRSATPAEVRLVRHLPDLQTAMRGARVSVSHAGYNTVADILRSGCSSVLFPHVGGRETEQLRRAEKMHELGISIFVDPSAFSAKTLAKAIVNAADTKPAVHQLDLEGATKTAMLLAKELGKQDGHHCPPD